MLLEKKLHVAETMLEKCSHNEAKFKEEKTQFETTIDELNFEKKDLNDQN